MVMREKTDTGKVTVNSSRSGRVVTIVQTVVGIVIALTVGAIVVVPMRGTIMLTLLAFVCMAAGKMTGPSDGIMSSAMLLWTKFHIITLVFMIVKICSGFN